MHVGTQYAAVAYVHIVTVDVYWMWLWQQCCAPLSCHAAVIDDVSSASVLQYDLSPVLGSPVTPPVTGAGHPVGLRLLY